MGSRGGRRSGMKWFHDSESLKTTALDQGIRIIPLLRSDPGVVAGWAAAAGQGAAEVNQMLLVLYCWHQLQTGLCASNFSGPTPACPPFNFLIPLSAPWTLGHSFAGPVFPRNQMFDILALDPLISCVWHFGTSDRKKKRMWVIKLKERSDSEM